MLLKNLRFNLRWAKIVLLRRVYQEAAMLIFIPGTYERKWKEGRHEVVETLVIRKESSIGNLYSVERNMVKQELLWEGKICTERRDSSQWMAVCHRATSQLLPLEGEERCTFSPEKQLVYLERQVYSKQG